MTLTEFLLARIAEDEELAWNLIPYDCPPNCCAPEGWVGHACFICGTREFGGTREAIEEIAREHDEKIHHRSRVLAECEAKRRIVERCTPLANLQVRRQTRTLAHDVLLDLALPYADHPDYRQEWKP